MTCPVGGIEAKQSSARTRSQLTLEQIFGVARAKSIMFGCSEQLLGKLKSKQSNTQKNTNTRLGFHLAPRTCVVVAPTHASSTHE